MPPLRHTVAAAAAILTTLLLAGSAAAATPEPWKAAADVRAGLRSAGIELLTDDATAAAADVREAASAYAPGSPSRSAAPTPPPTAMRGPR